ncbi:2-dehydropantoate 2-reductase [Radiobacillus kanasensis]|uniref:2-dehydropantoate 2-reductase n=1 Tax=Radiobacillus kanasensis TaxID=2844358 RepID=UPI001E5BF0BB|nr:2-dehydropantoate 2-reductase [Radiobacillus kanasensis]UFU00930.1 2-dehydropantoate 2-reductase [Radiobacillus kanasensis]
MRIGIIGGGAVGLLTAYFLRAQHEITIYVRREEQRDALLNNGVSVRPYEENRGVQIGFLKEIADHDILLICVKSYQLQALFPTLQTINCPIIFMQNGMGHIKWIKEANLQVSIGIGVFEHGVRKVNDDTVIHSGVGQIRVSPFEEEDEIIQSFVPLLDQDAFPFYAQDDWRRVLQEKLIANAVINPITALFQAENGTILQIPELTWMAKKLCQEASNRLDLPWEEQWSYVKRIIKSTEKNRSSMLVDIDQMRQTEVEQISGYLMENSQEDLPYTSFMYHSIKALERQKRGKDG